MYSPTQAATLIDALLPTSQLNRRIARDVLLIVGFSLFTALMARFVIHLSFTPVPITGQTLAVLLTGATLGSRRGAAALALYLVEGSVFPVFAGGSGADFLFQANAGGYIFGFSSGSAGLVWNLASGGYIIGFIPVRRRLPMRTGLGPPGVDPPSHGRRQHRSVHPRPDTTVIIRAQR